jgi:hypothetical protein
VAKAYVSLGHLYGLEGEESYQIKSVRFFAISEQENDFSVSKHAVFEKLTNVSSHIVDRVSEGSFEESLKEVFVSVS